MGNQASLESQYWWDRRLAQAATLLELGWLSTPEGVEDVASVSLSEQMPQGRMFLSSPA
jgi:hypothetical protein